MAKKRRVKIVFDFYEVVDNYTKKSLKEVLDYLSTVENGPEKTLEIFGEDVRLEEIDYDNATGNYKASFVKLRPMEKIGIYSYTGGKREITLNDNEYVGEEVSFYFDPSMHLLVIQRNKYGISSTGAEKYFQHYAQDDRLELRPMLTEDTYKKLLKQKVISAIETSISIPSDGILEGEVEGWAFGDIKKIRDQLGALKIGVIFTVEDSRKSKLDFKTAAKLIKELRDLKNTNKLVAKVKKDENAKLEELNMFNDLIRMTYWKTIEMGKTLSTYALQDMAMEAYNAKKEEIQQLFLKN